MQQILEDVGKDVGIFLKDFTLNYVIELIKSKLQDAMDEAVETVVPSQLSGGGDDDGVEVKKADEKEDSPPIAAGSSLLGYRHAVGPDRVEHRYYDFACWSIRPVDSVIVKCVRRHKQLGDWIVVLRRDVPDTPDQPFPKKKRFGKNHEYYTNRFIGMKEYFRVVVPIQSVSTSENFLTFWNLKYDETKESLREVFFSALEATCKKSNIDWSRAKREATRLGLDLDETEMLKVVAVEKVGRAATDKIRAQVYGVAYIPGPLKGRFINSAESKLAGIIATSVEAGWGAAKDTFQKIVEQINAVLDKGMDPIKDLLKKALEPVGNLVKEKFDKLDEKMSVDDGLDREMKATRFPPLKAALEALAQGKTSADIVPRLVESVNKLDECYKYVGYLRYNLGDPEIGQYIPFINEIQDNHYRLTIALSDIAYVLSRAGINSFEPLWKYVDKISESGFDEKEHQKNIEDAVREGGRRLAIDFFSLPDTCSRVCWSCGSKTEKLVLKVAQSTTWAIADLLGSTATNWKPTSKEDARSKFLEALQGPLDKFIADQVKTFVTVVRKGTQNIIANQFLSIFGDPIDKIADTLNDLCSKLPSPIGDNLKAGDIVKYLIMKMVENVIVLVVKKLAGKTESYMYSEDTEAPPVDKDLVWRLRWAPRIRNYDDDSNEPEKDENAENKTGGDQQPAADANSSN